MNSGVTVPDAPNAGVRRAGAGTVVGAAVALALFGAFAGAIAAVLVSGATSVVAGLALLGALIILRPGLREVSDGHVAMIFTAIFFGVSYLLAKKFSGEVSAGVVVAMLSLTVTIGLAPFALAVWVPVTAHQVFVLFCVACFATAGHYTMTRAFAAAPLTVTQPVTFVQLVWATLLGALVFGEPVDVLAHGAAVIVDHGPLDVLKGLVVARGQPGWDRGDHDQHDPDPGVGDEIEPGVDLEPLGHGSFADLITCCASGPTTGKLPNTSDTAFLTRSRSADADCT